MYRVVDMAKEVAIVITRNKDLMKVMKGLGDITEFGGTKKERARSILSQELGGK